MLHLLLNCHCTKLLLEVLWNMHPLSGLHIIAGNAYGHLNLFNGVSVDIIIVNYVCPYEERCVNLCLLPLSYRREMHDVTLVFKMMRVFNWCDISHYVIVYDDSGRLRVNQASAAGVLLKPRRTRTETYHSSFFIRIIDIWNNLPPTSRNCTSQRSFEKHIEMFDQEKLLAFSTDDMCSWLSFCRCESCKCTKLNVVNSV